MNTQIRLWTAPIGGCCKYSHIRPINHVVVRMEEAARPGVVVQASRTMVSMSPAAVGSVLTRSRTMPWLRRKRVDRVGVFSHV